VPIDYYVSHNFRVGQLPGMLAPDGPAEGGKPKRGPIVIFTAPEPTEAASSEEGRTRRSSQGEIGKEYDTPDWTPDKRLKTEGGCQAITVRSATKSAGSSIGERRHGPVQSRLDHERGFKTLSRRSPVRTLP